MAKEKLLTIRHRMLNKRIFVYKYDPKPHSISMEIEVVEMENKKDPKEILKLGKFIVYGSGAPMNLNNQVDGYIMTRLDQIEAEAEKKAEAKKKAEAEKKAEAKKKAEENK